MFFLDLDKKKDGCGSYRRRLTRQVSMHTLIGFNDLRLNVKLCDASLILDNGDTFPIHRTVMSGSSDYFRSVQLYIERLIRIKKKYSKNRAKSFKKHAREMLLSIFD